MKTYLQRLDDTIAERDARTAWHADHAALVDAINRALPRGYRFSPYGGNLPYSGVLRKIGNDCQHGQVGVDDLRKLARQLGMDVTLGDYPGWNPLEGL